MRRCLKNFTVSPLIRSVFRFGLMATNRARRRLKLEQKRRTSGIRTKLQNRFVMPRRQMRNEFGQQVFKWRIFLIFLDISPCGEFMFSRNNEPCGAPPLPRRLKNIKITTQVSLIVFWALASTPGLKTLLKGAEVSVALLPGNLNYRMTKPAVFIKTSGKP